MLRTIFASIAALAGALAAAAPAAAQAVSPAIMVLPEESGGYAGSMTVANPRGDDLAFEIEILERVFEADGETETPADGDFVVFPMQGLIAGEDQQTVRLQYVGEPLEGRSKSYRVWVREVLAPLSEAEAAASQVRMRSEFGASLHLVPAGARPELSIAATTPAETEDGAPAVRLRLENAGGRFVYLFNTTLSAGGTAIPMETLMATANAGRPIGPGGWREIVVPLPEGVDPGASFSIEVTPRR